MNDDNQEKSIKETTEDIKGKETPLAFDEMLGKSLSEIIKRHKQDYPDKWDNMLQCENHLKEEIGLQELEMLKIECNKWLDASFQPWINEKINKDCSHPRLAKMWFFWLLEQISSYNLTETKEAKDKYK